MRFSGKQTTRNDFPIDQNHNDSSAAADYYPTPASNTPLPYLSSYQSVGQEMTPHFYPCCAHTGWMFPEEMSSEASTIEPKPLPTDASTSFNTLMIFALHITEHEIWDLPLSKELTNSGRNQDLSSFIQYPSRKHNLTTSTVERNPDRNFMVTRASSTSDKRYGRSEVSSSSESQALPKRRYSSTGEQYNPVAIQSTGPEMNIGSANGESEARPLAKSSHSIIERKYRDNINTRITELDQTLFNTRHPKCQPDKPEADEHPHKTSKAEVLNGAVRYIKQAELESMARIKEIDSPRLRVVALEKLVN